MSCIDLLKPFCVENRLYWNPICNGLYLNSNCLSLIRTIINRSSENIVKLIVYLFNYSRTCIGHYNRRNQKHFEKFCIDFNMILNSRFRLELELLFSRLRNSSENFQMFVWALVSLKFIRVRIRLRICFNVIANLNRFCFIKIKSLIKFKFHS